MTHAHYEDCHLHHFPCCLIKLRELETLVSQLQSGVVEPDWLKRLREPHGGMVPCGEDTQTGAFTHHVHLTLHRPGPTWASASDDPPTR